MLSVVSYDFSKKIVFNRKMQNITIGLPGNDSIVFSFCRNFLYFYLQSFLISSNYNNILILIEIKSKIFFVESFVEMS